MSAGTYLTAEQLTARVGGVDNYLKLTNDENPLGANPDPDIEEQLLDQVDRIADAYASRGGYTVPLASADSDFVLWALLDIANYRARSRGPRKASDDDLLRYQDAIKFFEAVANGGVELPSGTGVSVIAGGISIDSQVPQLFNRRTLRVW